WLYYANRLQQLPLGVVGAAISVALLPILSKQLKSGDVTESQKTQDKAVEYAALLSFPAAVMMIILARPMINILFQHGQFSAIDTTKTAYALMAYAVGLPCYVMVKALMPNFFARGDTLTPVKFSAVVFTVNLCFNLLLMFPLGHVGIALATTIAAFVSLFQYIYGLKKRGFWRFSRTLIIKIVNIAAVSVLAGCSVLAVQYGINTLVGDWLKFGILLKLCVFGFLGALGITTFLIFAFVCHILDIREILKTFLKRA
ncbi:MAG: polysaccharide biosynthesis C-terminal domain-containing protein, partial [Alphaproteobacteria bacterium]|nr:polysaccharide biosynthesis C-terminal domain-containing protein [Alphaproteobacteria bacterium]